MIRVKKKGKKSPTSKFLGLSKGNYADCPPPKKKKTQASMALFVQSQQKVQPQTRESRPLRRWKEEEGGKTMMGSAAVRGAVTRTVGVECWPLIRSQPEPRR